MTIILVPKGCSKVEKILDENKIIYKKLNDNYITVETILNNELKNIILKFNDVFIVENNETKLLRNYIKKDQIIKLDSNDALKINNLSSSQYFYPTEIAQIYN